MVFAASIMVADWSNGKGVRNLFFYLCSVILCFNSGNTFLTILHMKFFPLGCAFTFQIFAQFPGILKAEQFLHTKTIGTTNCIISLIFFTPNKSISFH